jgi:hypothetical protein
VTIRTSLAPSLRRAALTGALVLGALAAPPAGGTAEMLHPPALGIDGNRHMLMQDRNNLQIADLILDWIGRAVRTGTA